MNSAARMNKLWLLPPMASAVVPNQPSLRGCGGALPSGRTSCKTAELMCVASSVDFAGTQCAREGTAMSRSQLKVKPVAEMIMRSFSIERKQEPLPTA